MKPLRIAMIGQKGIPARYGGVETHVENIATRLVTKTSISTQYSKSSVPLQDPTRFQTSMRNKESFWPPEAWVRKMWLGDMRYIKRPWRKALARNSSCGISHIGTRLIVTVQGFRVQRFRV